METRGLRRSITLSEQMAMMDSLNLRDLFKIHDNEGSGNGESLTLASVIAWDRNQSSPTATNASIPTECRDRVLAGSNGRTLLDIIQDEHRVTNDSTMNGSTSSGSNNQLKSLKDRLRLRRAAAAWAAAQNHRPNSPHSLMETPSVDAVVASTSQQMHVVGESSDGGTSAEVEQPARVSLMALLEQTDRQWDSEGEGTLSLVDEAVEEVPVSVEEGGSLAMVCMCCVCMVRQKGAAFIPCGHTFCRVCSRELWVKRGNCPLCNGHIVEILDIF